jgi:hypothetical protein
MSKELDYRADRHCPAYGKVISVDLCYDSLMCLNGTFKISSTKELSEIKDIEAARKRCRNCPYSKL